MIANEIGILAGSLWAATAEPAPDCPPLSGSVRTDIAIVGGGFTGLSAALHLAEAGADVLVLEAETPGWGASGRNGGQVIPGLKHDPDAIEERFGTELGRRVVALSGGAPDLVFSLIEKHGIRCDAVRSGWIQPSHSTAALNVGRARHAQWSRRGAPIRMLDRDETEALTGSPAYVGGTLDERGGSIHPLNYALGLARAALAAGARIHGESRVTQVETKGGDIRLVTPGGEVIARRVMICTNGYTEPLVPPLDRTIVPVRSVQVATRPLSDNLRRTILPQGHVASDSRRLLLYFRLDRDGRFIMGGRGAYAPKEIEARQQDLRAVTRIVFPQLGDVEWEHAWGGYVALTTDHYPHLDRLGDNMVAALGYNGRGVAMGTAMGRVLADWARGKHEAELDFPVTAPRAIPLHGLRKPIVSLMGHYYRLRDRLEAGGALR
jgi:glycine/D-amino acid oxidase-like deaminating enzyme